MEHKPLRMTASQKQRTRKAFTEDPQRPLTCRVCSRPWHWCTGACDCALLLRTVAVHPPTVFPPGANLPSRQLGNRGQLSNVDSPRNSHIIGGCCAVGGRQQRGKPMSQSHSPGHMQTSKTGRPGTPPSLAWKPLDWTGRPRFKMYGHETARRRCQLLFVIFPCKLKAPKILKGNFSQSCFFPFLM